MGGIKREREVEGKKAERLESAKQIISNKCQRFFPDVQQKEQTLVNKYSVTSVLQNKIAPRIELYLQIYSPRTLSHYTQW